MSLLKNNWKTDTSLLYMVFSALLEHIHAPHDSIMEVLETTVLIWIEDFSDDEELNVSKAWHTWRATQQQNLLQNEIGDHGTQTGLVSCVVLQGFFGTIHIFPC